MRRRRNGQDRGAAAVEFAIVVPFLILLALVIWQFGYQYQQKIQFTNAAVEAARSVATSTGTSWSTVSADAIADAKAAAGATDVTVNFHGRNAVCDGSGVVTVTIQATRESPAPVVFGSTFTVTETGQMRCE